MEYKLLDHFAEIMNVNFLSELKDKENIRDYKNYIQGIDEEAYTLADWQDACNYLIGKCQNVDTVAEAKKRLLDWLML